MGRSGWNTNDEMNTWPSSGAAVRVTEGTSVGGGGAGWEAGEIRNTGTVVETVMHSSRDSQALACFELLSCVLD